MGIIAGCFPVAVVCCRRGWIDRARVRTPPPCASKATGQVTVLIRPPKQAAHFFLSFLHTQFAPVSFRCVNSTLAPMWNQSLHSTRCLFSSSGRRTFEGSKLNRELNECFWNLAYALCHWSLVQSNILNFRQSLLITWRKPELLTRVDFIFDYVVTHRAAIHLCPYETCAISTRNKPHRILCEHEINIKFIFFCLNKYSI